MEAYSSSSSMAGSKDSKSFPASLHSIRKPIGKPGKKPISPLQPTPPKVYKVDPINFRDLVQKLTGGQHQTQSSRLQRVAPQPPPVQVAPPQRLHMVSGLYQPNTQNQKYSDASSDSLGFNLSPSSYKWCSFPILSPATLSSLDQSSVP